MASLGPFVSVVVALVAAVCLRPCSGLPVDERELELNIFLQKSSPDQGNSDLCLLCKGVVDIIKDYLEENASVHKLYPVLEPLCVLFMNKTKGYNGDYMCPGVIYAYVPVIFDIITEGALKPSELCHLLHLCNGTELSPSHFLSLVKESWKRHKRMLGGSVDQSATGEERGTVTLPSDGGRKLSGEKRGGDTTMFLHLSDIHLDQQYSEGSPSLCNLYLCCRSWYNGTGPAGHYGNYKCDLPLVTLDIVVEAIAQLDPQPDFIIYTGDNSPHDLWNETWASQYQTTEYLINYLSQKLPNRRIYPALGNHETYPESEYIGTLPQYQELTHRMAQYWQSLVPLPQSAVDTIEDGGYYTMLIRDKLRLLSFNSDYGFTLNLYATLNSQNPYYSRQQEWIVDTLDQAQQAQEKVIIIAHVPPGHPGDTLHEYEEFYLNLTRRYNDTIVAHLFGHTHHDEFKLIQDEAGVYGTVMACPSVTPRSRSNPSFRVFTMDTSTYQLQGYQQFHLNLTLANELAGKGIKPKMELAYTTSDLYHLPDLSPASWADLVERFSAFPDLVSDYLYNVYGQSSSHDRSCDAQCVHETICTVSNIVTLERTKCINNGKLGNKLTG